MCTQADLARWRACFPRARSLALAGSALTDQSLAPLAGWGLTTVHLSRAKRITPAGLTALCTPSLTTLMLDGPLPRLTCADVAAATARCPRLRCLALAFVDDVSDAHLAGWGGLVELTLDLRWRRESDADYSDSSNSKGSDGSDSDDGGGGYGGASAVVPAAAAAAAAAAVVAPSVPPFTGSGFAHLRRLRALALKLPWSLGGWVRAPLAGCTSLEWLQLAGARGGFAGGVPKQRTAVPADGGLFERAPASLASVEASALDVRGATDGGAALLAPLAHVAGVSLELISGLTDDGLEALTGAASLVLWHCSGVRGGQAWAAALAGSLTRLRVSQCSGFRGDGLCRLRGLADLFVAHCHEFGAAEFAAVVAGCPRLASLCVHSTFWIHSAADSGAPQLFSLSSAEATLKAAAAAAGAGGAWTIAHSRLRGGRRDYSFTATRAAPASAPAADAAALLAATDDAAMTAAVAPDVEAGVDDDGACHGGPPPARRPRAE